MFIIVLNFDVGLTCAVRDLLGNHIDEKVRRISYFS